jgi:hypothetical protein
MGQKYKSSGEAVSRILKEEVSENPGFPERKGEKKTAEFGNFRENSFLLFFLFFLGFGKKKGVAGFYNGIQSKIVQSVLNSAMLFSSKERFYQLAVFLLVLLKLRAAAPVPAK